MGEITPDFGNGMGGIAPDFGNGMGGIAPDFGNEMGGDIPDGREFVMVCVVFPHVAATTRGFVRGCDSPLHQGGL